MPSPISTPPFAVGSTGTAGKNDLIAERSSDGDMIGCFGELDIVMYVSFVLLGDVRMDSGFVAGTPVGDRDDRGGEGKGLECKG